MSMYKYHTNTRSTNAYLFFFVLADIRYKKTERPFNERERGGGEGTQRTLF